jgi:biopolymer transport protein ExbD
VELPKSAASDEQAQSPLTVTLTKDNHIFVNGDPVANDDDLVARFQKARAAPGEPSLVVSADAESLHGRVVHVIGLGKREGIVKFAINVASE